jgi:hypothetical protein
VTYEDRVFSAANPFTRGGHIDTDRSWVAEYDGGDLFNRDRDPGINPQIKSTPFLRRTVI